MNRHLRTKIFESLTGRCIFNLKCFYVFIPDDSLRRRRAFMRDTEGIRALQPNWQTVFNFYTENINNVLYVFRSETVVRILQTHKNYLQTAYKMLI